MDRVLVERERSLVTNMNLMKEIENRQQLPEEIMYEILLGLPVKALKRFCLVCKPWDALISQPPFQNDHYRRRRQTPLFIVVQREKGRHNISTYDYNKDGFTLVNKFSVADPVPMSSLTSRIRSCLGSCLGLVCIAGSMYESIVFVCNPSTQETLVLPPHRGPHSCIGIGYSTTSNQFKVIDFYYSQTGKNVSCSVFTLGTGEWREAKTSPFQTPPLCLGTAPFLQGAFHLLHCKQNEYSITAFYIETQEYKPIPVPKQYCPDIKVAKLSEIRGSLCLIGAHDNYLELWLLKDYKSVEWVKEYNIDLSLVTGQNIPCPKHIFSATPLDILSDGSLVLALEGLDSNDLLCYSHPNKIAKHDMDDKDCSWGLFVESFRTVGSA